MRPTPYTLQWLKQGSLVTVSKEALCDVLPMDTCHVLFCRPWLFDNHVIYDGHSNIYAFKYEGCNLTLVTLPPPKPFKFKLRKGSETKLIHERNTGGESH